MGDHPVTGRLGLSIQVVHHLRRAHEQGLGLVNGNHRNGIDAPGGIVRHRVGNRLGEVLRHTGGRRHGRIHAVGDGRHQGMDVFRSGDIDRDSLGILVDRAGVDVIDDEVADAGLVMQDGQSPVDDGIPVGYMQSFGRIHVQFLPYPDIAGGSVRQGQGRDFHSGGCVHFREPYHDAAARKVYVPLVSVQGKGADQTVTAEVQVADRRLGAGHEAQQGGRDIEKFCFHTLLIITSYQCSACNGRWKRRSERREWADTQPCRP